MTRRQVAVVVAALLLASCGAGMAAPQEPNSPPSSTTAASTSTTTSHVTVPPGDHVGLAPITPDVESLPAAEMVDGGCGWTEEAYLVTLAEAVFSGRPLGLGERGMTPDALGQVVEIEVVDVYVDDLARLEPGTSARMFVPDTLLSNGYRVEVPGPDLAQVMTQDLVTVFGYPDGDLVQPVRVLSEPEGSLSFNGYCDHEGEVLADVAEQLGYPNVLSMLVQFAQANAQGEGISDLSDAFAQWRADTDAASEPLPWEQQDPATRQLGPGTVSADLRASLDVFGVFFALDDLGDADAVGVRSESGVSWSLIAAPALPAASPLYFLRDRDERVEVFVQSASPASEARVIGAIDLSEIADAGGGIEVTGSVRNGTVTIIALSHDELAERLGIEPDQLDELRTTYLSS